jgi:Asp-tRNA(Asn)/Glu-tRNA(Gln) amidotransferase A subunit family amidase
MTALDLGSDLSGSLRQPAHTTGVFTLKPSFGVVPGRGHIPGPPGTLSSTDMAVLGPIGRTADDLDLALTCSPGPTSGQRPPGSSFCRRPTRMRCSSISSWLRFHPERPTGTQTNERRQQLRARWQAFFRSFDVLLTPVSPVAAIAHDHTGDVFSGRPSRRYPGDRAVSGGPRGNRRRPPHRAPPRRIRRAADRFVGRRPTAAAVTAMRARQAAWRGRRPGRPGCRPWCRRRR